MATPSTSESVARKPDTYSGSPSKFLADGEFKENAGMDRKPLPSIPIPSPSARIHGAPMSPVRVNVQAEDRLPKASVAVIEDGARSRTNTSSDHFDSEGYEPRMPMTADIPYRPNMKSKKPTNSARPGNSANSSGASSTRSPSDGSLANSVRHNHPESADENESNTIPVPRLQYYHQSHDSDGGNSQIRRHDVQAPGTPDLMEAGQSINRHLTPTSFAMRNSYQRPMSAYSDMGARGRSPGLVGSPQWGARAPSAQSGRSDNRPMSYVDLNEMSYPQQAPPPIPMDNSGLRSVVGTNASLLSTAKTLEMYRQNVKKVDSPATKYSFAMLLIQTAQEAGYKNGDHATQRKLSPRPGGRDLDNPYIETPSATPQELVTEAKHILQKLAERSYPFAQYYLGDAYASGLFRSDDYNAAFPLFIAASKHGHAEAGYRAALCYEFGWGTKKDVGKAVQYYRQASSKNHPGAMTRLGRACLSGDLGLNKYREGIKWLNRATDAADFQYNNAPYHLAALYETGYGDDIFKDEAYAIQLYTKAADLGHAEACFRLGDAYEHGKLSCPKDPALSIHFYNGAAQANHPQAMMALCAWYLVGASSVLEQSNEEAYEWAFRAAELGECTPPHSQVR